MSNTFPPHLQYIKNPKPLELGTWNFHTMFTTCHVSCVKCHMSNVTCHLPHVYISHVFFLYYYLTNWWSWFEEGLLLTGPTPSSFPNYFFCFHHQTDWMEEAPYACLVKLSLLFLTSPYFPYTSHILLTYRWFSLLNRLYIEVAS